MPHRESKMKGKAVTFQVSSARRGVSWARGRGQAGVCPGSGPGGQAGVCPGPEPWGKQEYILGQGQGAGRSVSWARNKGQAGKQTSRQNLVLKIQHATLEYDFVWES